MPTVTNQHRKIAVDTLTKAVEYASNESHPAPERMSALSQAAGVAKDGVDYTRENGAWNALNRLQHTSPLGDCGAHGRASSMLATAQSVLNLMSPQRCGQDACLGGAPRV